MKSKHLKKCKSCNLEFSDSTKHLFPIEKHKLKDGSYAEHYRQSRCRVCSGKRGQERTENNRLYIKDLKEKTPCKDCNKNYPHYVMHFDHLRDKKFNIGSKTSININKIINEINKCEIVCANCHAERTYKRQKHSNAFKSIMKKYK
jgi:hypothetical protein